MRLPSQRIEKSPTRLTKNGGAISTQPSQKSRKQYAKRSGTETGEGSQERDRHSDSESDSEDAPNMLDDWDAWMNSDSDVED